MAVRRESVVVDADVSPFLRGMRQAQAGTRGFLRELETADSRMSNLVQTATALAPAIVPIGAAATPAVAGLATQLGFAAAAGGVAIAAFNGIGDALKALNAYQLEPSQENLAALGQELEGLTPAAREFTVFLDEVGAKLGKVQDVAANGMLPGVQDGIESALTRLPEFRGIVDEIATTLGDLTAEAGANLADPRWDDFFTYLETNARPILSDFLRTMGNLVEGTADLWMAVDPLTQRWSDGFLQMSRDFATWADQLDGSQGLEDFIDYVDRVGPKVGDTLGAIGDALVALTQAAAPVGEVALPVIEAFADTLAAVARSDVGPVLIGAAAGLSAVSRAVALYNAANGGALGSLLGSLSRRPRNALTGLRTDAAALMDFGSGLDNWNGRAEKVVTTNERLGRSFRALGTGALGIGAFTVAMTDLDDSLGLSNTAMLTAAGTLAGPYGAAIGAGVGSVLDLAAANNDLEEALRRADAAMDSGNIEAMRAELGGLMQQLAALETGSILDPKRTGTILNSLVGEDEIETARDRIGDLLEEIRRIEDGPNVDLGEMLTGDLGGLRATREGLISAAMSADEFANSLNRVEGALTGRASLRDYEQAIDDVAEALRDAKETGRTFLNSTKTGFNIDKQLGRDLEERLDNVAQTALRTAETLKGMDRTRFLDGARRDFIAAARSADITKAAARALADEFGLVDRINAKPRVTPQGVERSKGDAREVDRAFSILDAVRANPQVSVNTGPAIGAIAGVKSALNNIPDETVYVRVQRIGATTIRGSGSAPGPGLQQAEGGIVTWADGGTTEPRIGARENHVAQIAPAGAWRVWAEPETGGEAYIPLASSKRPRSRAVTEDVVTRLGGMVQWFADGGINAPRRTVVHAPSGPLRIVGTLDTPFGPADVEGIAYDAAEDVYRGHKEMDAMAARAGRR